MFYQTNNEKVSKHAEMVMLDYIRGLGNTKCVKKNKIYVFRISRTKVENSQFFGSMGYLQNVWFSQAFACWKCYSHLRDTGFALKFKWLTPNNGKWDNSILDKPKPSLGSISFWLKYGISEKEHEDLSKNGDTTMIEHLKIKIRIN